MLFEYEKLKHNCWECEKMLKNIVCDMSNFVNHAKINKHIVS